jgi:hypothetical protein
MRSFTFQQALPVLARLSEDPVFVSAIVEVCLPPLPVVCHLSESLLRLGIDEERASRVGAPALGGETRNPGEAGGQGQDCADKVRIVHARLRGKL